MARASGDDEENEITKALGAFTLKPDYSHTVTVEAITSCFNIFHARHNHEVVPIEYPPATGWPQITRECPAFSKYSEKVIRLLRHIPYVTTPQSHLLMDFTTPINYMDNQLSEPLPPEKGEKIQSLVLNRVQNPEAVDKSPNLPHIVQLGRCGTRNGYDIYIDTERGCVYWYSKWEGYPYDTPWPDAKPYDESEEKLDSEHPDAWMKARAYRIETFFEMCKEYLLMI